MRRPGRGNAAREGEEAERRDPQAESAGRSRERRQAGGDRRAGDDPAAGGDREANGEQGVIDSIEGILRDLIGGVGSAARTVAAMSEGPLARARGGAARGLRTASVLVTPTRALLVATLGCALLLALTQFVDYRGVVIGGAQFEEVEGVAPPPEVDREEAGSAHAYAFVPAAMLAALIAGFAAHTGRWRLCRLVALIGIVVVLVSFGVDRSAGLDEGEVARDFADTEAKLLSGWWAQLFAGLALIGTSLTLGLAIKDSPRAERRPAPPQRRPGAERAAARRRAEAGADPAGAGA